MLTLTISKHGSRNGAVFTSENSRLSPEKWRHNGAYKVLDFFKKYLLVTSIKALGSVVDSN